MDERECNREERQEDDRQRSTCAEKHRLLEADHRASPRAGGSDTIVRVPLPD